MEIVALHMDFVARLPITVVLLAHLVRVVRLVHLVRSVHLVRLARLRYRRTALAVRV
jgi:hypothetical protein